ncbi:putative oxygenase MesX [Microbacterium karelineae]|uniref:putative oxygenase MesX n=1 Tax=Microbacterium karelineae TaxID=2654283 RepID=UPI0012EA0BA3|nr:putative oxygenase MesX [Microbacterium karelineae]
MTTTATDLTFSISTTRFDEDYTPSSGSRITTNFANLARGEGRRQNLRNVLTMIDDRVNDLADQDNPRRDRYAVELDIVSVDLHLDAGDGAGVPLIEVLDVTILDKETGDRILGITGNNFSSYVRDYDFSVVLPAHKAAATEPGLPSDFGDLHGKLFQHFVASDAYRRRFAQPPVVCISVSTSREYRRTAYQHSVLGWEYAHDADSLTDLYFGKMGQQVRYFMPRGSAAPLAFYHQGDLTADHSDLALIGTISTMEAFQKIYRPEIYNARSAAGEVYRPSLDNPDYSVPDVSYDREERSRLGAEQGRFTEEHFMKPYRSVLDQWAAGHTV